MTVELTVLISVACAILGGMLGVAGHHRNERKDVAAEAKDTGAVLTEIGYIKSGIDDIKAEQRDQRKMNQEMISRLTAVEASTKQAHKRVDSLEERIS